MFDWITAAVEQGGYFGIFLLMLAENVFPPIPSELIMPLAGFSAARGDLNIVLVLIAGTLGSLLGATFWYYIGKAVGHERLKRWAGRHGRWFTLTPAEFDQASDWFRRHAGASVFFGRLIPTVRTLISVPAGVAEMPLAAFLAWSTLGTAIWTALLAFAGYVLESQYELVEDWVNPVANVVVAGIVVIYLYRVITFRGDNSRA